MDHLHVANRVDRGLFSVEHAKLVKQCPCTLQNRGKWYTYHTASPETVCRGRGCDFLLISTAIFGHHFFIRRKYNRYRPFWLCISTRPYLTWYSISAGNTRHPSEAQDKPYERVTEDDGEDQKHENQENI